MIIKRVNQENVVIFLPNNKKEFEFSNIDELEQQLKELFIKIEKQYKVDSDGFYIVNVYNDPYYGKILDIDKESLSYIDYIDDHIEISIRNINVSYFLYQVSDILDIDKSILKKSELYYYKDIFYIRLLKQPSKVKYMRLLEQSEIIFGDLANDVIKFGQKIDF